MKIAIATKPTVESLSGSVIHVEHASMECKGLRLISSWGLRIFFLLTLRENKSFYLYHIQKKYQNVKIKPMRLQIKIMM